MNGVGKNLFRKQTMFYCTLMLKFCRTVKSSTLSLHKAVVVQRVSSHWQNGLLMASANELVY